MTTTIMPPDLNHHPLIRADGSATFSSPLFTILAAVNGPIEVQRRDELPEEAAIEVNLRPSSGAGGPRERWLESVIHSLLRSVLLVHMHPRTLVQVTLQVTKEPGIKMKRGVRDVTIVPALANAAFLALVDGGLPLGRTMCAGLAVVRDGGDVVVEPGEKEVVGCTSLHALVYTREGELLLDQSSGRFDLGQWEDVAERLRKACVAATASAGEDTSMMNGTAEDAPWLRQALEEKARDDAAWRESG